MKWLKNNWFLAIQLALTTVYVTRLFSDVAVIGQTELLPLLIGESILTGLYLLRSGKDERSLVLSAVAAGLVAEIAWMILMVFTFAGVQAVLEFVLQTPSVVLAWFAPSIVGLTLISAVQKRNAGTGW